MFFTKPSLAYKDSYIKMVEELENENYPSLFSSDFLKTKFHSFLQLTTLLASSNHSVSSLIPESQFWLIHQNNDIIGRVSIRHHITSPNIRNIIGDIGYAVTQKYRKQGYGKQLLKFGLETAKQLSFSSVILTCDEHNIGSQKIIEFHNGLFLDKQSIPNSSIYKLRYLIPLN